MLKLKLQYFGHLMQRTDSFEKTDAGKDWGQKERGMTEDEMVGWHHRLNGHEFEQTLGVGDGQGGLACCDSRCRKESDMTEWLNWIDSCFIMLCWFLYNKVNQLYVYITSPPLGPPSPSPFIPPLEVLRAPSRTPWAIQQVLTSSLSHTWPCIYVDPNLLTSPTPLNPRSPCVHTSFPYDSDSPVYLFEVWGWQLLDHPVGQPVAHWRLLRAFACVCSLWTSSLAPSDCILPSSLCRWPGPAP